MSEVLKESAFLVTNASGRHINLLNDIESHQPTIMAVPSPPSSEISDEKVNSNDCSCAILPNETQSQSTNKRKYHCIEPGCTKSFTTSGHLARHNRIHTGEKNFPCLFPGCLSRFSRQDNMMQHYRTHMSPKSRRTQKKVISEDLHPRPRLHAHQRIRSDPYRVERPLTIDQHLNNYRRSLFSHPSSVDRIASSVKYNMPTPLGAVAASHMQKQQLQQIDSHTRFRNISSPWSVEPEAHESSSMYNEETDETIVAPTSELPTPSPLTSDMMFYQHKPLTFTEEWRTKSSLPVTLLHPSSIPSKMTFDSSFQKQTNNRAPPSLSSSTTSSSSITTMGNGPSDNNQNVNSSENSENNTSSSQAGLLQLAHIVSTFG